MKISGRMIQYGDTRMVYTQANLLFLIQFAMDECESEVTVIETDDTEESW